MKIKLLGDGNDGRKHLEAGATVTEDSEWARRMLINGLAEPLDDEAKTIAADKGQIERYSSATLKASAKEIAKLAKK